MSEPEHTGNSEDPPRSHRSWVPRPKFASIVIALTTFIGAVATVAQLIGYMRSNEINLLVSSTASGTDSNGSASCDATVVSYNRQQLTVGEARLSDGVGW